MAITTYIHKTNSRRIYAMFSALGIRDKELQQSIVMQFTNGRSSHTSDLTRKEEQELMGYLNEEITGSPDHKMRRKIIRAAHLLNWKNADGTADMERINAWCMKFGQYHKELNAHSHAELCKLLTQFEKMFKSYIKKV